MNTSSLSAIISEIPIIGKKGFDVDPQITSIVADSRQVQPGALFVATRGGSTDGHQFIPSAIAKGAVAVVGEQSLAGLAVPYLRVENARQSLAYLSAAFHGYPARKLTMIGVTGTDGKTTTSNILYQILLAAVLKTGMISTVNAVIGAEVLDTGFHVTTPDAPDVQRYLAKMVEAGLTHVILETTSHGWAQYRVDACEFDLGIVTNITHEHLDYHGSYENYRAAKSRLFTGLAETLPKSHGNIRLGVLNFDDQSYPYLADLTKVRIASYGLSPDSDVRAENIVYAPSGIRFTAVGRDFRVEIHSQLVGAFNISNCLAALTAAIVGLGIDPQVAARGIASLPGVPGRMERIDLGQNFTAIVDFAHTPNALKVALQASRPLTDGRVIAIFGSAGLRDKEKRRMMAEVAAELADVSILTAEDPRTESLDQILGEMSAGARSKGALEEKSFWRVKDRGEAIRLALKMAQPGDLVISCGKGHEQSMCFGTTEYLWDDRTAMRAALSELLGLAGPAMPYLPTQEKE
ncbi:MAG: UDP-N-acetylmuramoyl-L-alanyl-D-glutamate--2,6-diaminopimelate ligase [Chloroflexi bacterium]|nr:UDP-N-acetylmuramoyl-L-alanyl-D-glutamate--2,6-diaminopimelate ligase [Chloroflexota bacterium]